MLPFDIHIHPSFCSHFHTSFEECFSFLYSTKGYTYSWSGKFIQLQYELPSIPWDFCYIPWYFPSSDWAFPVIKFIQSSSTKQAREVLLEYGLPPLGTKESPNPAYIIFLSVSRSPKDSAYWSTRYSLSARVISLSNSREFVASDTIRREGSTISN